MNASSQMQNLQVTSQNITFNILRLSIIIIKIRITGVVILIFLTFILTRKLGQFAPSPTLLGAP